MPLTKSPCLNLAIARLAAAGTQNFAIWVLEAPYPGGYVLHDCIWSETLNQSWQAWQQMFSPHQLPEAGFGKLELPPELNSLPVGRASGGYGSRLMQHLGISLWHWLFSGPIESRLAQSKGIAFGQNKPLRVRLDIREPNLIALPWEIMQPEAGKPAISVTQNLLFSRTSSDVESLQELPIKQCLNILLVLGQPEITHTSGAKYLNLEQEAYKLEHTLKSYEQSDPLGSIARKTIKCKVDTLLQPTPAELISQLETQKYNIFFYAGHGMSAPDGGLLFLRPGMTINGTELAQVLRQGSVTLCVINACWGAQPARAHQQVLARSSLAEVLLHHGVPAVLGMRDEITDHEALSFIETFVQALAERKPIEEAVCIARQQLLALYKFNYPAWTLPVLYIHPEFDGVIRLPDPDITQLPGNSPSGIGQRVVKASLREAKIFPSGKPRSTPGKVWSLQAGFVRVGRLAENDIVIPEPWISQRHAEIFCRNTSIDGKQVQAYFLKDNSRFGTLVLLNEGWQKVHLQEVRLQSGMQLKFGSSQGQTFEFIVES